MFDYKKYFDTYCQQNNLSLRLSFDMPNGYENANGMFDIKTKTVFINADYLCQTDDCEKMFYLFHELRHASQYLCPDNFSDIIRQSLGYSIMYDGTCYKLVDGDYKMCRLDCCNEDFSRIYLCQPYEIDANKFAYEQVKEICGDSDKLCRLYKFWVPCTPISSETYYRIFDAIDKKI